MWTSFVGVPMLPYIDDEIRACLFRSTNDAACMAILFRLMGDIELCAGFTDNDCLRRLGAQASFVVLWSELVGYLVGLIVQPTQAF